MSYSVSKSQNIIVEYLWLGLTNEIFSKTRVIRPGQLVQNRSSDYIDHRDIPEWDYDGSSTGQATTEASEVILKPCALYRNPFHTKGVQSFIVLCSTYTPDDQPLESNSRHNTAEIFREHDVVSEDMWFGIEFEYMMYNMDTGLPIGASNSSINASNSSINYCNINAEGRNIVEEHMMLCLDAGIGYDGFNSEVVVSQWEYQIFGRGIAVADQSIVARYLLERVAFNHGVFINWHPKPFLDKNGQGKHVNCSTKSMRESGGIDKIYDAIQQLGSTHEDHMTVYGKDNEMRLTGKHETSSFNKFTSGVADRTASVRIGSRTAKARCGYFEDRRPASNADEYLVISKLAETILLI
jgi:glutamine synthetase